jgi:hypothetical protein
MAKKNKNAYGTAGEFYVAGKLAEKGYSVCMAARYMKNFDLYVSNGLAARLVQVKTTQGNKAEWTFSTPPEAAPGLIFVFVRCDPESRCAPGYYIVPSRTVKRFVDDSIKESDRKYLEKNGVTFSSTGKKGVYHFGDPKGVYKDRWNKLGIKPPSAARSKKTSTANGL